MRVDTSKIRVMFDFMPETHFLVHNPKGGIYQWSLNPRIDRSEKGKDDDVGCEKIWLTDNEAEICKKSGFTWIEV